MKKTSCNRSESSWFGLVKSLIFLLVIFLGTSIFLVSLKYFDADNTSGYLSGKEKFILPFFRFVVITHLISASILLLIGGTLIFFRIEKVNPKIHRLFGKFVYLIGSFVLVPSGVYLSYYAMGGVLGKSLFFILSIFSLICLNLGVLKARKKNFDKHRDWMIRFYILLTSALWLRINMFFIFNFYGPGDFQYITASILSWIPQLILAEFFILRREKLSKSKL